MTSLSSARLSLAFTFLRDSEQPKLSHHGRVSAAFEAGYIAALVVLDTQTGTYEHPSSRALRDARKMLATDLSPGFDIALFFLEHRYAWQPQAFDLKAMQTWAVAVTKAANRGAL